MLQKIPLKNIRIKLIEKGQSNNELKFQVYDVLKFNKEFTYITSYIYK